MSLYFLRLECEGIREPHWHPNAAELSYCLEGRALMTIFSPGAGHDSFTVDPGEIVFVPKGFLHHIENINQGETIHLRLALARLFLFLLHIFIT